MIIMIIIIIITIIIMMMIINVKSHLIFTHLIITLV